LQLSGHLPFSLSSSIKTAKKGKGEKNPLFSELKDRGDSRSEREKKKKRTWEGGGGGRKRRGEALPLFIAKKRKKKKENRGRSPFIRISARGEDKRKRRETKYPFHSFFLYGERKEKKEALFLISSISGKEKRSNIERGKKKEANSTVFR